MAKPRKPARARNPRRQRRGNSSAPRKMRRTLTARKARVNRPGLRPKRSAASSQRRSSKQTEVIALLRRPEGVTIAEVVAATGWQPHSVRGLFSATLKKKLGLSLASEREERGRIYRIVEAGARQRRHSR